MPRGDGTGPAGMGPMTGRAAGYCAGYPAPGFMNPVGGRGFFGRGGGAGRGGWRNSYYATGMPGWQRAAVGYPAWGYVSPAAPYAAPGAPSDAAMAQAMKAQAEFLEQQLEDLRARIAELEKESAE